MSASSTASRTNFWRPGFASLPWPRDAERGINRATLRKTESVKWVLGSALVKRMLLKSNLVSRPRRITPGNSITLTLDWFCNISTDSYFHSVKNDD